MGKDVIRNLKVLGVFSVILLGTVFLQYPSFVKEDAIFGKGEMQFSELVKLTIASFCILLAMILFSIILPVLTKVLFIPKPNSRKEK
jgi:uncharacterized membrane protein YjgN (DUF898 family)